MSNYGLQVANARLYASQVIEAINRLDPAADARRLITLNWDAYSEAYDQRLKPWLLARRLVKMAA